MIGWQFFRNAVKKWLFSGMRIYLAYELIRKSLFLYGYFLHFLFFFMGIFYVFLVLDFQIEIYYLYDLIDVRANKRDK